MARWETDLSGGRGYKLVFTANERIPSDYISTNRTYVDYTSELVKTYSGGGYYEFSRVNPSRVYWNGNLVYENYITYDFRNTQSIVIASGSLEVIHDNDGSKTINVSAFFSDEGGNNLGSAWAGGNLTLINIPRQANVTNATDFNDEENPTIQFSNPGGFRINARLEFGGVNIRRDNIPNTGSYTFELTNEERELLRSKTPNSNTLGVREVIATCIGGTTETNWSWQDKKMTITNAQPYFEIFDFNDTNTTTLALTGNSKNCIIGYSNIMITITKINKAVAVKQATMVKYRFVIGNKSIDIPYSSTGNVTATIEGAGNGTYTVYAIDSRGNATQVDRLANEVIQYEPLYIDKNNSYPYRDNGGKGANGYLRYKGNMWNGNFGQEVNEIVSATYQFKKTSSNEWITGTTDITPTLTENEFNFNNLVRSDNADYKFDLDSSYNFKIRLEDKLSIYELELTPMASSIPNLSINKNGVGIMCDYDTSKGGLLQVGGDTKIDGDLYLNDKEIGFLNDIKTYSQNGSGDITFTAPFNGIIDITAIWSGWGYDGDRVDFAITNTVGNATQLQRIGSSTNGHNSQAVLIFSKAFYYVEKNKTYTFHSGTSGRIGGALSSGMVAILRRGQSI